MSNGMIKVTYVDHMGDDLRVVNSARISMGKEAETLEDKDKKLIKYLADHKHMTPFEHNFLSVIVECPLDIRSQIVRHRTFSFNEVSRRYTSEGIELFTETKFRKQHKSSKQCSDGDLSDEDQLKAQVIEQDIHKKCMEAFQALLDIGVSREQARRKLPIGMMTKFYMSGNLRNWSHFLSLRLDSHAQEEAQIVARQIRDIIVDKYPYSGKLLLKEL